MEALPDKFSCLLASPISLENDWGTFKSQKPLIFNESFPRHSHSNHRLDKNDRLELLSTNFDRLTTFPVLLQDDCGGVKKSQVVCVAKFWRPLPCKISGWRRYQLYKLLVWLKLILHCYRVPYFIAKSWDRYFFLSKSNFGHFLKCIYYTPLRICPQNY